LPSFEELFRALLSEGPAQLFEGQHSSSAHSRVHRPPPPPPLPPPLGNSSTAAQREVLVRIGPFAEPYPYVAACARGWFDWATADVRYRVECSVPRSVGSHALAQLDSGLLDLFLLDSTSLATALARGVGLSLLYINRVVNTDEALVARTVSRTAPQQKDIRSPKDLDGLTVGVPFGSSAHYHLSFLMELFEVQIDLRFLPPDDLLAAWDMGLIDAAWASNPTRSQLQAATAGTRSHRPSLPAPTARLLRRRLLDRCRRAAARLSSTRACSPSGAGRRSTGSSGGTPLWTRTRPLLRVSCG